MVLYQVMLINNVQVVDLQLSGGRYKVKIVGINYQVPAGNTDTFIVQFQAPFFMVKGCRVNSPIQYLTYCVPTTNTQISHPMEFVTDYFGSFQVTIQDVTTGNPVANNRLYSCLLNLDVTPFNPNHDHLE